MDHSTFRRFWAFLCRYLRHFPWPLGPPVGPTPAVHNNVMKLVLVLEVEGKLLEGNEVLAKIGKIFAKYVAGVELGDFVFVDWIVDVG